MQNKIYISLAMAVSAALGYWLHPMPVEKVEEREDRCGERTVSVTRYRSDDATVAVLQRQVKDLKAKLADSRKREGMAASNAVVRVEDQHGRPSRGPGWERLEELRKSDPERFAQVTNRFARMHQERKRSQEARAAFLASVGTSNMSAKDLEIHDEYQELLVRREELEDQMHQTDLANEARHELMEEMREVDHRMRSLGEAERKILLNDVAQAIGMQGEAATELIEAISDIVTATASVGGPPGPPPAGER